MIALVLATVGYAQDGFDGHGFMPAASDGDLQDLLITYRPEMQTPFSVGANGLFEYADSPVVLVYESNGVEVPEVLVDNVFALNLAGHTAVHERVGIGLAAPVYFTSLGPDGEKGGLGFGDMRLSVPVTILYQDDDSGGFGVSAIPVLDMPSGAEGRLLGNGGFGGGVLGAFGYHTGPLDVNMNLGIEVNPSMAFQNLQGGANLLASLGASYMFTEEIAGRLEARMDPTLRQNAVPWSESPVEMLFSARGRYSNGAGWTIGGAAGLSQGVTAARFRFFAGFGWTFGKSIDKDTDDDGILDANDSCPEAPETVNGYTDEDGCPDELATVVYRVIGPTGEMLAGMPIVVDGVKLGMTDENGELTVAEKMPETVMATAEVTPHIRTALEAKAIDAFTLEPGLNTREVKLIWLPGAVKVMTRDVSGPIQDSVVSFRGPVERGDETLGDQGEGFFVLEPGEWTLFVSAESFGLEQRTLTIEPNQRTLVVIEVEMKPAVVQTTKEEVVILEQVKFDTDKSDIRPESQALLDEVAANIARYETLTLIEVQGHTDSDGSNRYNQRLSQDRVNSVVAYITSRGVAPERLVAVGYGESCPIADNATAEGREDNRRVQFIILDPAPESGVPCHDGNPAREAETRTIEISPAE